jgi:pimeloyl-ACP methyl ester carboxylesterase
MSDIDPVSTSDGPATLTKVTQIKHQTIDQGIKIFYREAGAPNAPTILLLHGYPTSSHMFRELIPQLAKNFHVIAPDIPGFGFTEVPAIKNYVYNFDNLAKTIDTFVEAIGLKKYAIYIFDYGAPVGLRLALAHPEQVTAIISQNGNAYEEGLGEAWTPIQKYWSNPNQENRDALREFLGFEGTYFQYTHGVSDVTQIAPESYTLDTALLQRPGNAEIQLDLFLDYANNLKLYPAFQAYFRESQVPTLCIWGKNDPFFIPAGAEAFKRDNKNAQVEFLDTGHFALETHAMHIGERITKFLQIN